MLMALGIRILQIQTLEADTITGQYYVPNVGMLVNIQAQYTELYSSTWETLSVTTSGTAALEDGSPVTFGVDSNHNTYFTVTHSDGSTASYMFDDGSVYIEGEGDTTVEGEVYLNDSVTVTYASTELTELSLSFNPGLAELYIIDSATRSFAPSPIESFLTGENLYIENHYGADINVLPMSYVSSYHYLENYELVNGSVVIDGVEWTIENTTIEGKATRIISNDQGYTETQVFGESFTNNKGTNFELYVSDPYPLHLGYDFTASGTMVIDSSGTFAFNADDVISLTGVDIAIGNSFDNSFDLEFYNVIVSDHIESIFLPPPLESFGSATLNDNTVYLSFEDNPEWESPDFGLDVIFNPGDFDVIFNPGDFDHIFPGDHIFNPWPQPATTIDVLSNDTDADGDSLTIIEAVASSGNVEIGLSGNVILYTPFIISSPASAFCIQMVGAYCPSYYYEVLSDTITYTILCLKFLSLYHQSTSLN